MKYNANDLVIPLLLEKTTSYNTLHKIYINNINSKEALDACSEMNIIKTWFKQKGLIINKSHELWETFILNRGTKEDITSFNQLALESKKYSLNQDYKSAKDISQKKMELLDRLAENITEAQFYLTNDILTYVDSFIIRENICTNYKDLIDEQTK